MKVLKPAFSSEQFRGVRLTERLSQSEISAKTGFELGKRVFSIGCKSRFQNKPLNWGNVKNEKRVSSYSRNLFSTDTTALTEFRKGVST